jgi:hypothetical protein
VPTRAKYFFGALLLFLAVLRRGSWRDGGARVTRGRVRGRRGERGACGGGGGGARRGRARFSAVGCVGFWGVFARMNGSPAPWCDAPPPPDACCGDAEMACDPWPACSGPRVSVGGLQRACRLPAKHVSCPLLGRGGLEGGAGAAFNGAATAPAPSPPGGGLDFVLDGLYIASGAAAARLEDLHAARVTHVVNAAPSVELCWHAEHLVRTRVASRVAAAAPRPRRAVGSRARSAHTPRSAPARRAARGAAAAARAGARDAHARACLFALWAPLARTRGGTARSLAPRHPRAPAPPALPRPARSPPLLAPALSFRTTGLPGG